MNFTASPASLASHDSASVETLATFTGEASSYGRHTSLSLPSSKCDIPLVALALLEKLHWRVGPHV